jgi:zinc D-Ala-D-Ala carboxypeptidase
MKLSKNFSLAELTKSETAIRRDIDNTPSDEVVSNLTTLCNMVLQKVRDSHGVVTVTSGYRSPELNKAIGGSTTSDHCKGLAVDFEVPGLDNKQLALWIQDNLIFKQLILEFYNEGEPNSGWVHCSFEEGNNNNQVLTATKDGKKTVYLNGIQ